MPRRSGSSRPGSSRGGSHPPGSCGLTRTGQQWARAVIEVADRVMARGNEISIIWVPAHRGVPGNEVVDGMAKTADRNKRHTHTVWSRETYFFQSAPLAFPASSRFLLPRLPEGGPAWLRQALSRSHRALHLALPRTTDRANAGPTTLPPRGRPAASDPYPKVFARSSRQQAHPEREGAKAREKNGTIMTATRLAITRIPTTDHNPSPTPVAKGPLRKGEKIFVDADQPWTAVESEEALKRLLECLAQQHTKVLQEMRGYHITEVGYAGIREEEFPAVQSLPRICICYTSSLTRFIQRHV